MTMRERRASRSQSDASKYPLHSVCRRITSARPSPHYLLTASWEKYARAAPASSVHLGASRVICMPTDTASARCTAELDDDGGGGHRPGCRSAAVPRWTYRLRWTRPPEYYANGGRRRQLVRGLRAQPLSSTRELRASLTWFTSVRNPFGTSLGSSGFLLLNLKICCESMFCFLLKTAVTT